MKVRVLHLATGLETGGAELMLFQLLANMDRERFHSEVVSLREVGPVGARIRELAVPVHSLGMRPGRLSAAGMAALVRRVREFRPHVIQTWMYHADLVGGVLGKVAGGVPVAWGLHTTSLDPQKTKRGTRWTIRACSTLSHRLPRRIVCCAESTRNVHIDLGYAADKMTVIHNGFDVDAFRPEPARRDWLRRELNLAPSTPVIGLLARFHPQKDHQNFIRAAACLRAARPEVHYVLCGEGVTWENAELAGWIHRARVQDRVHLLGRREDVPAIMAGLDLLTSSSAYGEAFPLVIGEAMACGIPCVATDVGDSAAMIGDTGQVVPVADPQALARAWAEVLALDAGSRSVLGQQARSRVLDRYAIGSVASQYADLYTDLL